MVAILRTASGISTGESKTRLGDFSRLLGYLRERELPSAQLVPNRYGDVRLKGRLSPRWPPVHLQVREVGERAWAIEERGHHCMVGSLATGVAAVLVAAYFATFDAVLAWIAGGVATTALAVFIWGISRKRRVTVREDDRTFSLSERRIIPMKETQAGSLNDCTLRVHHVTLARSYRPLPAWEGYALVAAMPTMFIAIAIDKEEEAVLQQLNDLPECLRERWSDESFEIHSEH